MIDGLRLGFLKRQTVWYYGEWRLSLFLVVCPNVTAPLDARCGVVAERSVRMDPLRPYRVRLLPVRKPDENRKA